MGQQKIETRLKKKLPNENQEKTKLSRLSRPRVQTLEAMIRLILEPKSHLTIQVEQLEQVEKRHHLLLRVNQAMPLKVERLYLKNRVKLSD